MHVCCFLFWVDVHAGIPLFMNAVLRANGISAIVKEKMNFARFETMLALYIKKVCPLEAQRFARLVGNADSDPEEFERQARNEFNKLIEVQKAAGITADVPEEDGTLLIQKAMLLDQQVQNDSMVGTNFMELCSYMTMHDANGDG